MGHEIGVYRVSYREWCKVSGTSRFEAVAGPMLES
jgi:hypothetical protein